LHRELFAGRHRLQLGRRLLQRRMRRLPIALRHCGACLRRLNAMRMAFERHERLSL
jgi:hypothetical protein